MKQYTKDEKRANNGFNKGRAPVWSLPKEEMWNNEYKLNNDELVFKTAELRKEIERLMNA